MHTQERVSQVRHRIDIGAYRASGFFGIEINTFERQNSVIVRKAEISRDPIRIKAGGVDDVTGLKNADQSFYESVFPADIGCI